MSTYIIYNYIYSCRFCSKGLIIWSERNKIIMMKMMMCIDKYIGMA